MKPKMQWQQMAQDGVYDQDLVWVSYLDSRFHLEVHRVPGNTRLGTFYVWDHKNGEELVFQEEVSLLYEARFGPDMENVNYWCAKGIEIADNKYAEEKDKETRLGEDVQ